MKKSKKWVFGVCLLLGAGLSAAACGEASTELQGAGNRETSLKTAALAEPAYPSQPDREEDFDKWRAYLDENAVQPAVTEQVDEFAFCTAVPLLEARKNNLVYSPVSLYYALALAASGTGGDTAAELYDFLGASDANLSEEAAKLYRLLNKDSSISRLQIATSLWVEPGLKLKQPFLDTAAGQYYASIYQVDFAAKQAGSRMGQWVKEQTNGTIAPEIRTTPEQVMSILNTVYFYDEWTDAFREKDTKDGIFYLKGGAQVQVPFMNREFGSHGYRVGDGFTASQLSLKENGSMVFVLPDEDRTLEELLDTPEKLREALEGGESHMGEVKFQVPKFLSTSRCDIKEMMQKQGITKLFEEGDFSKMTEEKGLFVSAISQDSRISINEKGVEASAFTQNDYSGAAMPDGKAEIILNRPFLYGIRTDGVWLFIGVCDDPGPEVVFDG